MRFGVNYTPSGNWFHSWLDFSASAVARDFEAIASLGADHVRIFPLWPVVQPNRSLVRASALADIVEVVDIAASFGLDANVDALQGHLSSFDFLPSWLDSWHRRNMFTDPDVVGSTAAYVRQLASALAGRPNLLGVTIGNELNQFAHAPHPSPHTVGPGQAASWLSTMVAAARDGLGGAERHAPSVTVAQYDAAWYDDDQPFGPEHAAEHGDMTITHSWVFNGAGQLHGSLGAGSVRHGEYLMQLAAAWNREPGRPNWLQEVGAPTTVVAPEDAPDFVERTIRHAADVQNAFGVTWWCSHDVSRALADFPELEYDLGLFSSDGVLKPVGARFAEVARELGGRPSEQAPPAEAIVLDDVDAQGRPNPHVRRSCAPGGGFARAWLAVAEESGRGPQVVLRSRSTDRAMLDARGIGRLIEAAGTADAPVSVPHPAVAP
ncbi:glycoside hydrolase 5 family protein [Leifsonia shinshuensis]|uniref:Glycosyl hydrolase n=1 Tax=Leifsonia shinshuensis TaxID=150026 RepID=A0A7G6YAR8_9MICO|nr:glycosyl hydrolase [Leifsonia shinshuensis]QNE35583.1 glycosyl hydrolase [Leifsonia shinshuensis]